jgi:ankyrin repeat protein
MDIAGTELFELCQTANAQGASCQRHARRATTTTTTSPCHVSSHHEKYCWDRFGVTDLGTSLRRLLASHCRPYVVEEFLKQSRAQEEYLSRKVIRIDRRRQEEDDAIRADLVESRPLTSEESTGFDKVPTPPLSIRAQNINGATALHVAAFRNSAHVGTIIDLLLDWDSVNRAERDSLASIPMNCGSYPLHVLTGQNATIQQHALESLVLADPTVVRKEDINGDNPLSLLWKNTLRFRWAIDVMEGSTYIDYIREDDRCSCITIIPPGKYMVFSRLMILAALGRAVSNTTIKNDITFHELCSIPRCPPLLFWLARSSKYNALLRIVGDVHSVDDQGMLPLHHAVQQRPVSYRFVPEYLKPQSRKTLVGLLLEEYPESAMVVDSNGRLPLHYALESGYLKESDLLTLVKLHPDSLRVQDPLSGLYPFMLVASQSTRQTIEETANFCCLSTDAKVFGSTRSMPGKQANFTTTMETEAEYEWKKENVCISFLLLLLCPEAVQFQNVCLCH